MEGGRLLARRVKKVNRKVEYPSNQSHDYKDWKAHLVEEPQEQRINRKRVCIEHALPKGGPAENNTHRHIVRQPHAS